MSGKILIVDYDPRWPQRFQQNADAVQAALGDRVLRMEHTGSTSVPGLAAKPIVDMLLVVDDSSDEPRYAPLLEKAGYKLRIREPHWHQHRMFKGRDDGVNLHVFSSGCSEIHRVLSFRDHLRNHAADRDLYEVTKRRLALEDWKTVQDYADAKTAVIEEILNRARLSVK